MRVDLRRSLRRVKPERWMGHLARRPDAELEWAEDGPVIGPPILLDTCVYLDALEGSLPPPVERVLAMRALAHVSLVLGELSHNFGRLDPRRPGTARHLEELAGIIDDIPPHRIETPSPGVMLEAGILAGLAFRLGGFQPGQEVAALNDAAIYLHALERGHVVLTANARDFDLMSQLVPTGRVLLYRPA